MKTIERIFNASTGETTDIERDMTAEEIAEVERAQAQAAERAIKAAEAATQKQALLNKLGITEEEARLLLS
jgi:acyl-CoA reductase-like NAD-dependent aldehyde dehydrogenase